MKLLSCSLLIARRAAQTFLNSPLLLVGSRSTRCCTTIISSGSPSKGWNQCDIAIRLRTGW